MKWKFGMIFTKDWTCITICNVFIFHRFHNAAEEVSLNYDVVPPLSDDVQLTVEEYRNKLYEVRYWDYDVSVWEWSEILRLKTWELVSEGRYWD